MSLLYPLAPVASEIYISPRGKLKKAKKQMAITKTETIASPMIILSLVVFFVIDIDIATPDHIILLVARLFKIHSKDQLSDRATLIIYQIITSLAALICFAICCLYLKRAPTLRWKRLIVGTFLGSVGTTLSLCLPNPTSWDYGFRVIFSIDTVGIVVLLLVIFIRDKKITLLVALSVSSLVGMYIYFRNPPHFHEGKIRESFPFLLALIIYSVVSLIFVKHFPGIRWKVAVMTIFSIPIIVFGPIIIVKDVRSDFNFFARGIWEMITFLLITSINAISPLLLVLWLYARKIRQLELLQHDQYYFLEMAGLPTRFTTEELETATGNFQTPIGEGGSGAVFKGTMVDESIVAVKRIKGQTRGEEEFKTEISIIASLQHVNLVRLLGYCLSPRGDRYLIYPFFENGSLDAWLFKDEEKRARLTWMLRYRIAINVAKALAYFHHECHHRILHLDIKPANILLDSSFRALVSDFGISKSIGKDESNVMTTLRGTIGYLPPEMLMPNAISIKSDVYSYGMVLSELVGGRRNFMSVVDEESQQKHNSYFPMILKDKMMEGKLMEVVDPCLEHEEMSEEEVTILVRVALWCIQQDPELRPRMPEVVEMLERRMPAEMPPESSMFVVNISDSDSNATNTTVTISMLSGR